jgi:hypothetical protein
MTTRSMFRPTVENGGPEPDRPQLCVHVVYQAEHRARDHSGARKGIPLQTSTIRS